jgi:hypothetical protein
MQATAIPEIAGATDRPPRSRRRIPASLRLFAGLMALLGISSVLWIVVPAGRQHLAIQEIRRLGGHYSLAEQKSPKWLRELLGDERLRFFAKVTQVNLRNTAATDDSLWHFGALTELQSLYLDGTQITDAGLARLQGLKKLNYLDLHNTRVTDAGLIHLTGMTDLNTLSLHTTEVTDDGIPALTNFPKLWQLTLGPNVTDMGVTQLTRLTRLRTLWLIRTSVTPEGIQALKTAFPKIAICH